MPAPTHTCGNIQYEKLTKDKIKKNHVNIQLSVDEAMV